MQLDLKALRAHAGERVEFAGRVPLHESDFHEPVTPHGPAAVRGWAAWYDGEVIDLSLEIQVALDRACSRCLAAVPLAHTLRDRVAVHGTQAGELLPDAFAYERDARLLELKPVVLSLVLGAFEPKPLCKPDCLGLCPSCGTDLNAAPCRCAEVHRGDARLAGLSKLLEE